MFSTEFAFLYVYIVAHWLGYILATATLLVLCEMLQLSLNSSFSLAEFRSVDFTYICFIILLCSIIGIPPFFGFWTKMFLLMLTGACGPFWLIGVAWFTAITSLIFYFTALRATSSPKTSTHVVVRFNNTQANCVIGLILFLSVAGLFINQIYLILYLLVL